MPRYLITFTAPISCASWLCCSSYLNTLSIMFPMWSFYDKTSTNFMCPWICFLVFSYLKEKLAGYEMLGLKFFPFTILMHIICSSYIPYCCWEGGCQSDHCFLEKNQLWLSGSFKKFLAFLSCLATLAHFNLFLDLRNSFSIFLRLFPLFSLFFVLEALLSKGKYF